MFVSPDTGTDSLTRLWHNGGGWTVSDGRWDGPLVVVEVRVCCVHECVM